MGVHALQILRDNPRAERRLLERQIAAAIAHYESHHPGQRVRAVGVRRLGDEPDIHVELTGSGRALGEERG